MGYSKKQIKRFYEVFRPIYKDQYLMECSIYFGISELLEELKKNGFKLCVATNKREDYTTEMLNNLDLSHYFNTIAALDNSNQMNKKDLILKCLRATNSQKKETVMIGDTDNDYQAAKHCGIDFIAVTYGYGFNEGTPKDCKVATTICDLKDKLLNFQSKTL